MFASLLSKNCARHKRDLSTDHRLMEYLNVRVRHVSAFWLHGGTFILFLSRSLEGDQLGPHPVCAYQEGEGSPLFVSYEGKCSAESYLQAVFLFTGAQQLST